MAQTLEQLRTALAWSVSRMFTGTATGGTTTTLIDVAGLPRFTETDALQGGRIYIVTTTDGLAPVGESRRIQTYTTGTQTITVDRAFTAAVGAGDLYEIYLAPLTMEQWNHCINTAIRRAWPSLFIPAIQLVAPTGALSYELSSVVDRVLDAEIGFSGALAGYPSQELLDWYTVGISGDMTLELSRPVPSSVDMTLRVLCAVRFDELAAGNSTMLDEEYIMDAARAQFYQMMADASRQSDRGSYLQLMAHWQERAKARRQELALELWPPEEE